ncbi:MAG: restriction endonuclease [Gemmatimonadaceae bacterium]|nr:restriction endonuclease [Gemmatimonadaceae bacterium]
MPENKLREQDMRLIDELFDMGGGYVLDFTDRSFTYFFRDDLGIDIDHARFCTDGTSKAKRLRRLLRTADSKTCVKVLEALWEYRSAHLARRGLEEPRPALTPEFAKIVARLQGRSPVASQPARTASVFASLTAAQYSAFRSDLVALSALDPQPRGFAFEKFLKELFDASGLGARASFRLVGEQIDGSFELTNETYLLEAKWTGERTGAADLRSFNAKVEEKAAWSRGLFLSNSGFTDDGLEAFGRGKRVICMDGFDLYEVLERQIPVGEALALKARRAAESGHPFARIRDLFP